MLKKSNGFLKKATAVSMSAIMLSGLAFTVGAKAYDDIQADYAYRDQIDLLSDIGVIKGTSENEFSPQDKVSREQMALLLYRLMMAGRDNAGTVNGTAFTDLYDPTYHGAITWANATGYIIGTSPSTFEPKEGIMFQDALTMIVRAMGHSTKAMENGYPWTFIDQGIKLGLDNGLEKVRYTQELTRGEVAALLYNALSGDYLISHNGSAVLEKSTIIEKIFGYSIKEARLVATNDYTVGSNSTIIKSGYVTLESSDGSKMTVPFDKLGLSGKAENWLNRELRVIYTEKGGVLDIIGCAFRGKNVAAESVSFASDNSYVTINGVRYRVVETKSDSLSTNANELVVHMFGSDSALVPLKSVSELKNAMGFGTLTLIFDKSNSETASAAILKNATFGQLDITKDKINLAGGLKASQLTGGFLNEAKAESGDFVLYYFNSGNKSLEILEKLEISEKGLLTQLTSTSAVIGGKTYTLGMANSGVSASDIHSALMAFGLGKEVRVVAKNGVILAVLGADDVVKSDSSYLVALSQPVPVYTGGMLRYVMSASVDGITQDIFVDLTSVNVGKVYRYVKTADGLHSLKAIGSSAFTQTGEIAEISDSIASDTEIKKDGNAFFAIGDKKFVTDKNSVILVNDGSGSFTFHKGDYAGIIKANATSDVVAVMRDEIGAVDTLIYLYVSNGTLSDAEAGGSSVKILSQAGFELADGKYYTLYTVFNFATGEKTTLRSLHSDLTVGSTYATDSEGRISSKAMSTTEGPVTGFTATTVTVGSSTFTLASDVAIKAISASGTLSDLELDDLFMKKVELIKTGSVVKAILVKGDIAFTASYDSGAGKVKITADTDISGLTAALRSATKDGETIDVSSLTLSVASPDIVIDSGAVAAGEYAIVFTLNGTEYRVTLTV